MESIPAEADNTPSAKAGLGRAPAAWLILLLALAVVPGLFMGLHADDWFQARPRSGPEVLATFLGDWNEGKRGEGGFYRPLVRLSFAIDRGIWGLHPFGYHLTNGLLYIAAVLAVVRAGLLLAPHRPGGIVVLVGLMMVANPLKIESLYWVSGRTDLMAAAFCLWAATLGLVALRQCSVGHATGSLACLLGGLLSKEVALGGCLAVCWMTVVLAADRRRTEARLLIAGPLALAAVYTIFRSLVLGGLGGYQAGGERNLWGLAGNMLAMLSALWWPWQANVWRIYNVLLLLPAVLFIGAALVATGFRRPIVAFLGCMVLVLLPMIPITIAPWDGNRVLATAMGFQTMLLFSIFLVPGLGERALGRWAFVAAVLAMSLQPANIANTHHYLRAAALQREVLDVAQREAELAPSGTILVAPPPSYITPFRILNPGDTLEIALQTWWMEGTGRRVEDITDLDSRVLGARLVDDDGAVVVAPVLQPWMGGDVRVFFWHQDEGLKVFHLGTTSDSADALPVVAGETVSWSNHGGETVLAVGMQGPQAEVVPQFSLRKAETDWLVGLRPYAVTHAGRTTLWIDTTPTLGELPARLEFTATTGSSGGHLIREARVFRLQGR